MSRRRGFCAILAMAGVMLIAVTAWGAAGDVLWEKQLTFLPQYNTIHIYSRALSSTTYIITGYAYNANSTGGSIGFIKAFDVATGNIKWEKSLTLGGSSNYFGSMEINGDIAVIRGAYETYTVSYNLPDPNPVYNFTLYKNFTRAYNTDTGQQLWEIINDFEGSPISYTSSSSTITGNNRVFNCFYKVNTNGVPDNSTLFVRAYQVRNIALQTMLLLDK